jgi:hypothetical protein
MVSSRPFSVRKGAQKDFDYFYYPHGLTVFAELFDISDTHANLKATSATDDVTLGFYPTLQSAIMQLEEIFRAWTAAGIGNTTISSSAYKFQYYFNLYYEKSLNDTIDAQAFTDIQIDVNAVPTPDEPHMEEWCQRLGAIQGLRARINGVPGVNRLWDQNGDAYQIDVMSAIDFLDILGGYVGALAQSAVFGIIYEKQFSHKLSDIDIGKDSPLPGHLEYLDDPAGITYDIGSAYSDHVAVLDTSDLPNSTESIKSAMMHNYKLSKFGLDFGRKFYGHCVKKPGLAEFDIVHLMMVSSDGVATDVLKPSAS